MLRSYAGPAGLRRRPDPDEDRFRQSIVDVCNGGAVTAFGTLSVDKTWTANEADISAQGD